MKILVVGASGFVGHAIYQTLSRSYKVVAGVRNPKHFDGEAMGIDFTILQDDTSLMHKLEGFDVVVNAVGIIAERHRQTFEQIHTIAPMVLFSACREAGVAKIIQISALGSQKGTTPYHTSKNKADEHLRALGVPYAILHPSVVYGEDGKSTALFQGLASLPVIPIIGDGSQKLQPVTIDDLSATVQAAIASQENSIELDVVGEKEVTYKEMLQGFRRWLGLRPTNTVSVPTLGTNLIGKVLDEPTVNQDNITMLNEGNAASVVPLSAFLGYTPVSIQQKLFATQAHNAQKLYASLYLIRPLLRWVIGFVWIWSGVVSAFLYPQPLALALLHDIGVPAGLDVPLLYLASSLDIIIGILTLKGWRMQKLLWLQILVIAVYTLLLSLLAPHHWLHPFGPVLKNLPLIVAIYILARLEQYR